MAKYEKAFTPKRANTASAALYTFLADGQPHQVEDALTVVVDASKQEQSTSADTPAVTTSDQQRNRKLRSTARNAVYVARRSGRVQQEEGRLVLDASIVDSWKSFRGDDTPMVDEKHESSAVGMATESTPLVSAL
jgi:hypothetical protein